MKWEYKVEMELCERDLNLFGQSGWELVSVINKSSNLFYFKKPVEDKPDKEQP